MRDCKECADLGCGSEGDHVDIRDGSAPRLGVVLDLMLLLVELALAKQVIDRLVVLDGK